MNFVRALTGGNSTGKITFGTEGGLFQQELGIPAVVCGPGNIAVAHKPDEYVSEEQLALCDAMLGDCWTGCRLRPSSGLVVACSRGRDQVRQAYHFAVSRHAWVKLAEGG